MEPVIIQTRDVAFTIYMINIQCTSIIYVHNKAFAVKH